MLLQTKLGKRAAVSQGVSRIGVEEACVHFFSIRGQEPILGGGHTLGLGHSGEVCGLVTIDDEVLVAVFCDQIFKKGDKELKVVVAVVVLGLLVCAHLSPPVDCYCGELLNQGTLAFREIKDL